MIYCGNVLEQQAERGGYLCERKTSSRSVNNFRAVLLYRLLKNNLESTLMFHLKVKLWPILQEYLLLFRL